MSDQDTAATGGSARSAPTPNQPTGTAPAGLVVRTTPASRITDRLTKPSWKYIARKTLREFTKDQCTDLAAALTYYAVLALFPALLALVSLLGMFGQAEQDRRNWSMVLVRHGRRVRSRDTIRAPLQQLTADLTPPGWP